MSHANSGNPGLKYRLAKAQNGICTWCRLPLPDDLADTAVDHIIPKCRGGPDRRWNLQVLHHQCNRRGHKGTKLTPEAVALAAERGVVLREPLPTSWPGSSKVHTNGKPNPYAEALEPALATMYSERLAG